MLCINEFYFFYRRKLTQKLAETEEALSSATQKASNAEKAKNRLNSELEDALIDLEKVSFYFAYDVDVSVVSLEKSSW